MGVLDSTCTWESKFGAHKSAANALTSQEPSSKMEAYDKKLGTIDLKLNVVCAVLTEILKYLPNGAESHLARETQKVVECCFYSPALTEF